MISDAMVESALGAWIRGERDIRQAMRAALEAAEREVWQPIETALRDGTKVDLWFAGSWNCRIADCEFRPGFGWHPEGRGIIYNEDPSIITHWCPLPSPPEAP